MTIKRIRRELSSLRANARRSAKLSRYDHQLQARGRAEAYDNAIKKLDQLRVRRSK